MKPHRWVTDEPVIPFECNVIYEDAGIIVVDKPHFLATTPRGMWYRQTALIRLRERYGEPGITPAHRLDRLTAGVVVFVRDPALRRAYQMLFQERRTRKVYECLAPCAPVVRPGTGTVAPLAPPRPFPLVRRSHIVKDRGRLQAYEIPGGSQRGDRNRTRRSGSIRRGTGVSVHVAPQDRQNPPVARAYGVAGLADRGRRFVSEHRDARL